MPEGIMERPGDRYRKANRPGVAYRGGCFAEAHVLLPPLDGAYVGPVHPHLAGERLLAVAAPGPLGPDHAPQVQLQLPRFHTQNRTARSR
jgi:hypothetical protein